MVLTSAFGVGHSSAQTPKISNRYKAGSDQPNIP